MRGVGHNANDSPRARLDALVDVLDFGDIEGMVVALGIVLLVYRCIDKAFGLDGIGVELATNKDKVCLLIGGGAI